MGAFTVSVEIGKIVERPKFLRIDRLLVDTGSEMTWIAAETLRKLGITVRKKDQPFVMANGQTVTRDIGYALLRCGDFETVDEVVFAQNRDLQLLGAHTLEGFNAVVDPKRKRLVAAGPMPAAPARAPTLLPRNMRENRHRLSQSEQPILDGRRWCPAGHELGKNGRFLLQRRREPGICIRSFASCWPDG